MDESERTNRNFGHLLPGTLVEVKSASEIMETLDEGGCVGNLPFMPEMLQYCGKQFRVYRRADKTCDTVNRTGGRRMHQTVHLGDLRCDGSAHGGCQAACLLFWKEDWLKQATVSAGDQIEDTSTYSAVLEQHCYQEDESVDTIAYRCQATALPEFTTLLYWWDIRQYVRDLRTGNTTLVRLMRILILAAFRKLIAIGIGTRALISLYDWIQRLRNGRPYPVVEGSTKNTPVEELNLQPGEYVRVKSLEEINATLNKHQKNRGLWFDQEMAKFCGGTFRVQNRMANILDEKTGRMLYFKTPSVVLENVYCQSEFSSCRLFCPRSIYSYWREIWLERVENSE